MKVKSESEVAQSCPTPSAPWTAAYQAPPSMGFTRQEYWSGVPLPSPPLLQSPTFQSMKSVSGGRALGKSLPGESLFWEEDPTIFYWNSKMERGKSDPKDYG